MDNNLAVISEDGWLDLMAACNQLCMSRERLKRRIEQGQLTAQLRLGRWVVSAASLDAFARDHASGR